MHQLPDVSSRRACDLIEITPAPDLPGVEVLRVDAPARLWRWYHETYSVSTPIVPMRTEWKYRNRLHRTRPVTVAMVEPGEVHAEVRKLDEHEAFRVLLISPDVMQDTAAEVGLAGGDVHWGEAQLHDEDVFRDCLGLHAVLEHDGTALERQARFSSLVERLLVECSERPPRLPAPTGEPTAVRHARELLQERWTENVQLDDLAAACGIGRFHLIRAFHATLGLPPHAYQIRIRVGRAMTLIRRGMPLVEVALHTGFADQSHLTRHFARVVGVSPGRYRDGVR
jgi:AraC-like DNA-binding protein